MYCIVLEMLLCMFFGVDGDTPVILPFILDPVPFYQQKKFVHLPLHNFFREIMLYYETEPHTNSF